MKAALAAVVAENLGTITGEPRSRLIKVVVRRLGRTVFYTSWRPTYRCEVEYRIGGMRHRVDLFAKSDASLKEYEFHAQLWTALSNSRSIVGIPRPMGFFSLDGRNVVLAEFVPGHNLNTILSFGCVRGPHLAVARLLGSWSRKAAGWLSQYQARYRAVDAEMTAQQIELARQTLGRFDALSTGVKERLDGYLVEHSASFLHVHRAPSLDFLARNLILSRGRLFLVDLEPRGNHDVFHNGLEFCADLRVKTRYTLFARSAFDNIEQQFWDHFTSDGDEQQVEYSKILFSIHWFDYLLLARREFRRRPSPRWDAYIADVARSISRMCEDL